MIESADFRALRAKAALRCGLRAFGRSAPNGCDASAVAAARAAALLGAADPADVCAGVAFFAEHPRAVDADVGRAIVAAASEGDFEVLDTVCPLFVNLTNRPTFAVECGFLRELVSLLSGVVRSADEPQFVISGFDALANIGFYSRAGAELLFEEQVPQFALERAERANELLGAAEDDIEFFDCLYVTESALRLLAGVMMHGGAADGAFAARVVRCLLRLLGARGGDVVEAFVVENAYWIAVAAPGDAVAQLLTPEFLGAVERALAGGDGERARGALATLAKMTCHDDSVSRALVESGITGAVRAAGAWGGDADAEFCRVLRNFAVCSDARVTDAVLEPGVVEFMLRVRAGGAYSAQKEVMLVFALLVCYNAERYLEEVAEHFAFVFDDAADYVAGDDTFFAVHILLAVTLLVQRGTEMQCINEEFVSMLESCETSESRHLRHCARALLDMLAGGG